MFPKGSRFRSHDSKLSGKSDIIMRKYKTVIFVNVCFWQGHINCKYAVIPKTRTERWKLKIDKTKKRDKLNYSILASIGWHISVIQECDLKIKIKPLKKLNKQLQLNQKSFQKEL